MFNNSLMSSSTSSPSQASQENSESVPPSFLFANQNKRRSVALSNANPYLNSPLSYSGGPSTDIFASPTPIPAHVKESASSSGKSVHWSPNIVDDATHRSISRLGSSSVTKGPPLRSLREDMDSPVTKLPRVLPSSAPSSLANKDSPAGADHWVTVFGFPPNFTDKVIKLMSRHGEIVSQQVPSRGNWINLRYSCTVHAEQAMGRNAFLIDGVVRIGVVPCTDTEAIESANRSVLNLSHFEEPMEDDSRRTLPPPIAPTNETSFNNSMLNTSVRENSVSRAGSFRSSSRAGMRSLAATTRHNDSLKGSEPTKEGGLIGRLWSLVG
ncbi:npp-19 [Pristionchus pacificus]|uniref:Nucleoporin NUP53 n=1 Tax=Pristionchus pacificus TaxID=54126 RepID=A0A2A6BDS8_PRIPA|nr:npp-19 [Pristionchus pacificus]|eukprot:PDM64055.1 npp-19 [Pristionchus pacificus]